VACTDISSSALTHCRVEDSLKLLHGRQPTGRVLLLGLLPRVPAPQPKASQDPAYDANGSADGFAWPSPLAAGIAAVNERLAALADRCCFSPPLYCLYAPAIHLDLWRPLNRRTLKEVVTCWTQNTTNQQHTPPPAAFIGTRQHTI
jgi:hypothetical protein